MAGRRPDRLYRLAGAADWLAGQAAGVLPWSDSDRRDGFMHLSTEAQVLESARRHFSGRDDALALEIDPAVIDARLRFEPSRGGELFPHLYDSLPTRAVLRVRPLRQDADGRFYFADETA